ncbi:bifunctional metallophosphatase/5'-nucleotidase [Microbacterium amylolyticum]|uniref:5'-nucleotidase n=1 Tax=Microbacterium amylolyticum TaxID=936337 RepID=A0ABS4ZHA1_9MICO|nr:bifunctional UDP-sugar hydrolase/5'-nucleotidase [Microbacterium amylolyticum]MBP2436660.1 5'-nucleotidase [Microbacterium amylolyticum]
MPSTPLKRGIGAAAALSVAGSLLLVPQAATAATVDADSTTTSIQVLGINDFHGRLGQAANLAGALDALREQNPNTVFVSSGDNIGASTFTSFIQDDEPTIQVLAEMGLDIGAVGNHEFDQGYDDLMNRVIPSFDANGAIGADVSLGANVYHAGTTDPALLPYTTRVLDGVTIGFIGTVTPDTARMVAPSGVEAVDFGDQLEAVNRVAADIADEVDVTILLAHDGAEFSVADRDDVAACQALADEQTDFGALVREANVDAIFSGHTHQGYPCEIDGRPVIQANDYGTTIGALDIEVDTETNEVVSIAGDLISARPGSDDDGNPVYDWFTPNERIAEIVAEADAFAEEAGSVQVGAISADILRGGEIPGDDRGVESSMGNLVADLYLWATTEYEKYAGEPADIAVMNPGGLRDDLLYGEDGSVTYMEVANVQPFANTLTTSELTGADIQQMLEEQWQPESSRPKLHLGISDGFTYEYTEELNEAGDPTGEHEIISMTLNGEPIDPAATYTVTTNSFVSAGGDGFTAFNNSPFRDTGLIDLEATVDYFAAHEIVDPAPLGRAVLFEEPEPTPEPTPVPTEEPTPVPTADPAPTEEPAPTEAPAPSPDETVAPGELAPTGGEMTWVIGIGAGVLILAGIATILIMRSRKS